MACKKGKPISTSGQRQHVPSRKDELPAENDPVSRVDYSLIEKFSRALLLNSTKIKPAISEYVRTQLDQINKEIREILASPEITIADKQDGVDKQKEKIVALLNYIMDYNGYLPKSLIELAESFEITVRKVVPDKKEINDAKLEAARLLSSGFNRFCRSDADKTAYAADVIKLARTMAFNGVAVPTASLDESGSSPRPTIKHKIRWSEHKANFADPYDFLQKIYPEEIGPDLSWPRVLNLDSGLYHALKRHAGRGKLPEGVHILDRKEVTDRKYATLDPNQVRAAVNLASAVGKRKWRANRNP